MVYEGENGEFPCSFGGKFTSGEAFIPSLCSSCDAPASSNFTSLSTTAQLVKHLYLDKNLEFSDSDFDFNVYLFFQVLVLILNMQISLDENDDACLV